MRNNLICWEENNEKNWDMIKQEDLNAFLLRLLSDKNIDNHKIFVIPTSGFTSGIWLVPETHKSQAVDFWNFFEDYGIEYKKPKIQPQFNDIISKSGEKHGDNTKYGWISPDGRYFHCGYQGHTSLASNICFGIVETNNPERYLEEYGWCKIYKPLFAEKYNIYVGGKYVISKEQMETLIFLGIDDIENISEMLCKD